MTVADAIASWLWNYGVRRIYGLMGGGAAGLNDAFIRHPGLDYICFHHEQHAGHAAMGEAKFTNRLAVVNPTTGCGGTNCATSVLDAWQDSMPVLFLSGNVARQYMSAYIRPEVRRYGTQEHNIVETVRGITKHAAVLDSVSMALHELGRAVFIATSGRPGPVWLDVPADIQYAESPPEALAFSFPKIPPLIAPPTNIVECKRQLRAAQRPVIIAGGGIRSAGAVESFRVFIEREQVPFVTTFLGVDLLPFDHPLNLGCIGIKGTRAGNFAIHQADFLLILGSSLPMPIVGYAPTLWAPRAHKLAVDIDWTEHSKSGVNLDGVLIYDLKNFFTLYDAA